MLYILFAEGEVVFFAAARQESRNVPFPLSSETNWLLVGTMRYFRSSDIFGREGLPEGLKSPWALFLIKRVPEVVKIRPADWTENFFSGQSTTRSSRVILSPSYTRCFSSSIDVVAWPLQREDSREEFQNKDLRKIRRFLHCYFWLREKLVDKLPYYFSSIVSQLLKRDRPNAGAIG